MGGEERVEVHFVVNPRAGRRARRTALKVEAAATAAGLSSIVVETAARGHAEELARAARAAGARVVAAVGGDGTANEVARGLVGSDVSLALVPLGSGNGLARELGVSLDLGRACRQLASARPSRIDVGEVDGRIFLMNAGFGIDADVAHRFDRFGMRGPLPYFWLGARALASYRPPRLEVAAGEGTFREVAPLLLTIANTRQFGSGAVIAPTARADDGLLDRVLVGPRSFLGGLRAACRLFDGTIDLLPGVDIERAASFRVRSAGTLLAQVDGEPVTLGESVEVRVRPGALSVLAP